MMLYGNFWKQILDWIFLILVLSYAHWTFEGLTGSQLHVGLSREEKNAKQMNKNANEIWKNAVVAAVAKTRSAQSYFSDSDMIAMFVI